MDAESQKRKIRRFIKGAIKDGIDPFCIYQWIERCHFEGWWEMGVALGSHLQPNLLNKDYEKRLDYILSECRRNDEREKKATNATMEEIIDSLDGVEKDEALQLLKKLGIRLDMKRKDLEQSLRDRPSQSKSMKDVDYSFPTYNKETSPIHYINYLVYEEKIEYFDEVARKLSIKFHGGDLKKSKRLLYTHARHRGINLK